MTLQLFETQPEVTKEEVIAAQLDMIGLELLNHKDPNTLTLRNILKGSLTIKQHKMLRKILKVDETKILDHFRINCAKRWYIVTVRLN